MADNEVNINPLNALKMINTALYFRFNRLLKNGLKGLSNHWRKEKMQKVFGAWRSVIYERIQVQDEATQFYNDKLVKKGLAILFKYSNRRFYLKTMLLLISESFVTHKKKKAFSALKLRSLTYEINSLQQLLPRDYLLNLYFRKWRSQVRKRALQKQRVIDFEKAIKLKKVKLILRIWPEACRRAYRIDAIEHIFYGWYGYSKLEQISRNSIALEARKSSLRYRGFVGMREFVEFIKREKTVHNSYLLYKCLRKLYINLENSKRFRDLTLRVQRYLKKRENVYLQRSFLSLKLFIREKNERLQQIEIAREHYCRTLGKKAFSSILMLNMLNEAERYNKEKRLEAGFLALRRACEGSRTILDLNLQHVVLLRKRNRKKLVLDAFYMNAKVKTNIAENFHKRILQRRFLQFFILMVRVLNRVVYPKLVASIRRKQDTLMKYKCIVALYKNKQQ